MRDGRAKSRPAYSAILSLSRELDLDSFQNIRTKTVEFSFRLKLWT